MHAIEELAGYCNREQWKRAKIVSSADIPKMSKDMDEQLKVHHKMVDAVHRANLEICATPLRFNVDKLESS